MQTSECSSDRNMADDPKEELVVLRFEPSEVANVIEDCKKAGAVIDDLVLLVVRERDHDTLIGTTTGEVRRTVLDPRGKTAKYAAALIATRQLAPRTVPILLPLEGEKIHLSFYDLDKTDGGWTTIPGAPTKGGSA